MDTRFRLIKAFKDGHRFYTDGITGRIAVADQSVFDSPDRVDHGPHTSADGLLFVDFSRPIPNASDWRGWPSLGVVDTDGNKSMTTLSHAERDWLREVFAIPFTE